MVSAPSSLPFWVAWAVGLCERALVRGVVGEA